VGEKVAVGRLAELTIALSLATDLGTGQPLEHGLRTCWLSLKAAEALGLADPERSCVYHVALLRFLGCTSDASEAAVFAGGDDVAFNATFAPMLNAQSGESVWFLVRHLAADRPLRRRIGRVARALGDPGGGRRSLSAHCEAASRLASRLGLPASVCDSLAHAYERWDGKGFPDGLAGDEVPMAIRVVSAARDAELWARQAGWVTAAEVLARRRGCAYDPAVIDALSGDGQAWLAGIGDDPCAAVLDAEPAPVLTVDDSRIDSALSAVADFADLKSPFFLGHSTGVALIAGEAATAAGLSGEDAATLRRAGLVHDVGKVGVASGIWDHPGPLSADQWERVRLHTYLGERVLSRCRLLEPYTAIAARHHERVDGSGYHRGLAGNQLGVGARILAAADVYHALIEARPHRPALTPAAAATRLLDEVDGSRLGRAEVDAVLAVAGQASRPPHIDRPAGLTEREVDVLRLIARGQANKQVAATLGIAPKTVGRHIEHIYAKAGVTTRAGATLFAMEHGLLAL
jgi:HD-GYP domain-containing protein (c-di-GMP phosphodiesterase class II)/DNA-binding CsgD family transcriptional regulator